MNSKPKTTTLLRSPAKLNLFLHVINKRNGGYHSIESLFVPIMWFDEIYIEKTDDGVITREGDLAGDLAGDLLVKSAKLLKKYAYQYLGNHNEIIIKNRCSDALKVGRLSIHNQRLLATTMATMTSVMARLAPHTIMTTTIMKATIQ